MEMDVIYDVEMMIIVIDQFLSSFLMIVSSYAHLLCSLYFSLSFI